jgi:CrcB protein
MQLVLIAVFGALGTFSRYAIDLLAAKLGVHAHWATLAINLTGSFVVTLIYVLGAERSWIGPEIRTALLVGLMGGFTTFSSYSLQSALLLESGKGIAAVAYTLLSPIGGIAIAFAGLHLFRVIFPLS